MIVKTQTMNVAYGLVKFIAIIFCMSSICSYDHEIMQLTDIGGVTCVYQTSQRNWGDYRDALQVSPRVSVELAWIETGIATPYDGEVSWGPLGNTTSQ